MAGNSMHPDLARRIVAHYPSASAWDRFHLKHRLRLCPYDLFLESLPAQGRLLDIGCGFGHFGWFLAETRPGIEYYGSDIDERKIALAQPGTLEGGKTLRLFAGDARQWQELPEKFDAVALLDVLYLVPLELQKQLLDFAVNRLAGKPGAVLILKILPELRGWARWRTGLQERVMVGLGKTRDSGTVADSQNPDWYADWAHAAGMDCARIPLPTSPPSVMLVLKPRAVPAA